MEAAETDERRVKELAEARAKAAAAAAKAAQTASPAPADASGNGASAVAKPTTAVPRMISPGAVDQVFVTLKDWIVFHTPRAAADAGVDRD
jgi:hypothetical protein